MSAGNERDTKAKAARFLLAVAGSLLIVIALTLWIGAFGGAPATKHTTRITANMPTGPTPPSGRKAPASQVTAVTESTTSTAGRTSTRSDALAAAMLTGAFALLLAAAFFDRITEINLPGTGFKVGPREAADVAEEATSRTRDPETARQVVRDALDRLERQRGAVTQRDVARAVNAAFEALVPDPGRHFQISRRDGELLVDIEHVAVDAALKVTMARQYLPRTIFPHVRELEGGLRIHAVSEETSEVMASIAFMVKEDSPLLICDFALRSESKEMNASSMGFALVLTTYLHGLARRLAIPEGLFFRRADADPGEERTLAALGFRPATARDLPDALPAGSYWWHEPQ